MQDQNQVLVPIHLIDVEQRRREEVGDNIEGLTKSIQRIGLLHPIVVDKQENGRYRLVAGGCRLAAMLRLEWTYAKAQLRDTLTEEQLREIELEENERRKDYTDYERNRSLAKAKQTVTDAKRAREILTSESKAAEKEEDEFQSKSGPKSAAGRPKRSDSKAQVAEAIGASKSALIRDEQHVDLTERYPWMAGENWKQYNVLHAGDLLERFEEPERSQMVEVVTREPLVHLQPTLAIEWLLALLAMTKQERAHIYQLSQSKDPMDWNVAASRIVEEPPMPDLRLGLLSNAIKGIGTARQQMSRAIENRQDESLARELTPLIQTCGSIKRTLTRLRERINEEYQRLRDEEIKHHRKTAEQKRAPRSHPETVAGKRLSGTR